MSFIFNIAAIFGGLKLIEYLPETKGSLKHGLRHMFGFKQVKVVHYYDEDDKYTIGMRCVVCNEITSGDERKYHVTDPTESDFIREMREEQKVIDDYVVALSSEFLSRFGPKSYEDYLTFVRNKDAEAARLKKQLEE